MILKNSKIRILKKLDIETLPGYTNKYYNNSLFGFSRNNTIKSYYLKILKKYTLNLNEQRKLKFIFGITKKNYKILNKKFNSKNINKLNIINITINNKLDVLLVKLGYFNTLNESRQRIKHGHILINGYTIYSYNFIVKSTDILYIFKYNKIVNNNFILLFKYINNFVIKHIYIITNLNTLKSYFLTNIINREIFNFINFKYILW